MPGSAPPRMPQATPPNAAGTIIVVSRLVSTLERSRPPPGRLRNPEQHDEYQPQEDRARQSDAEDVAVEDAALVVGGDGNQRRHRQQVTNRWNDGDVDSADPEQAGHAPDLRPPIDWRIRGSNRPYQGHAAAADGSKHQKDRQSREHGGVHDRQTLRADGIGEKTGGNRRGQQVVADGEREARAAERHVPPHRITPDALRKAAVSLPKSSTNFM